MEFLRENLWVHVSVDYYFGYSEERVKRVKRWKIYHLRIKRTELFSYVRKRVALNFNAFKLLENLLVDHEKYSTSHFGARAFVWQDFPLENGFVRER